MAANPRFRCSLANLFGSHRKSGVNDIVLIRSHMLYVLLAVACGSLGFTGSALAGEKDRYTSGDNYNATQFSAPGLRDNALETIKMLIGSDVDAAHGGAHDETEGHGETTGHGEADAHGDGHGASDGGQTNKPYSQLQCGSFCRSVSDDKINEAYEACLGPCYKCNMTAIRAQATHGGPDADTAQKAFEACWSRVAEMGAFNMSAASR